MTTRKKACKPKRGRNHDHDSVEDDRRDDAYTKLSRKLNIITRKLEAIMITLDQILESVTDEGTKLDSLGALIAGLKQQIADALSGTTLPPAVQAKVDAVFAGVESNKAKVQTALDANVPPTV